MTDRKLPDADQLLPETLDCFQLDVKIVLFNNMLQIDRLNITSFDRTPPSSITHV
jgi:hypothetical protein